MKLNKILVAMVTTLLLTSAATIFYTGLSNEYQQTTSGYNASSLDDYNKEIEEINNEVNKTAQRIKRIEQNPLIPDLLGAVLIGGIGALQNLDSVLDITFNAFSTLVELIPLGPIGSVLVATITTAVTIVFFIGIVLAVITKSDRL